MRASGRNARRILWSAGAVGLLFGGWPTLEAPLVGARGAAPARALGVERAAAQMAVDHRVPRRGPSRASGRPTYALPAGHTTVEVSGDTYYLAQGVYFEAVLRGGEVAYVVVDVD